jgi:TatD DNase family protein
MLVDSHCHLDYLARDGDLDAVVGRARASGVGRMLTICTKVSEFDTILAIAKRYDDVWCTVGIHPHEAEAEPAVTAERLVALTQDPRVAGIGETGLDYFYEHSPRDEQQASFRAHIAAARASGLPLIVHTRDADEDTAAILEAEYAQGPFTGVIHCFSTGRELAERAVALGFYISLSGILTFKKAEALRETAAALPADRLLVETDAPYLAPVPLRGKPNEPSYVVHTAAALAQVRGVGLNEIETSTSDNFFRLFKRVERPAQPPARGGLQKTTGQA